MARTLQGDVRTKILQAARERMWQFGYKKTTIDEIAADAGVGKGTVYLYFENKEDIALAILANFKQGTLARMQEIVCDVNLPVPEKVARILASPVLEAHAFCGNHPAATELIVSVKPHIKLRLHPYIEQEIGLIADVLVEGNRQGLFDVADAVRTARTLKYMVSGFWPPYPSIDSAEEIELEIGRIVDLAIHGMRKVDVARLSS
jgi:AcrR family transcriptional regulator